MDQRPLVESQIEDGFNLVKELTATGFDVTAAFWVRPSEDRDWTLYIASKTYEDLGALAAIGVVIDAFRRIPAPWISPSDMTVIGASNPITADILEIERRHPGRMPTRFRWPRLGKLSTEEVYLYAVPRANAKVQANVQKFLDQGWERDGLWEDGFPRVRLGKREAGFVYQVRVDEETTPEKVPYLEGKPPKALSGTTA